MATTNWSTPIQAPKRDNSLPSEEYSRQTLPQIITTTDLTAVFVMAIFYITNAATAASGGAVSYVYWAIGGIVFFIPCVIATAQLGVMLPHEGSIYNWTHRALGPYWGFFAGAFWWFPGPIVIVSSADTIVTYIQGLNSNWLVPTWQQGIVVLAIVIVSGLIAVQRTRVVLNLVKVGVAFILCAVLLLTIATALWLLAGHHPIASFSHPSDWSINSSNYGLFGLITVAYLGTTVPLNMGGEIAGGEEQKKRKAITRHLLWGTLIVFAGYFVATTALLVVEGPTNGASPFALISIADTVLGKPFGNIVAIAIMFNFVIAAIMYNASFARLLLVGSIDQRLPRSAGRLNRYRVPSNAVIFQTVIAGIFTILVFMAAPYVFKIGEPANLSLELFDISLALISIVWALITIFFYVDLVYFYRQNRDKFRSQRIFPLWLLWTISVIGPIGCLITIASALFYSWIPNLISNTYWLLIVGGILLVCIIAIAIGSMIATSEAAWQSISEIE
jgi:amino acid transporter